MPKVKFAKCHLTFHFIKQARFLNTLLVTFSSFDDATKHQAKLKELGYKDCFVAAFKDGARMDINEAQAS
jgi:hypothetical protein